MIEVASLVLVAADREATGAPALLTSLRRHNQL
jgi:hypothetical protein